VVSRKSDFAVGYVYHVYNRGVHRSDTFLSSSDYVKWERMLYWYAHFDYPLSIYAQRLEHLKEHNGDLDQYISEIEKKYRMDRPLVLIYAYVEMPNHYHMVLEQNVEYGISKYMHKLSTAFTQYFNQKYNMTGSLFQGRYKALRAITDEQLHQLMLYVLRNPIEAKLVSNANPVYQWSSVPELIDTREQKIISVGRLPDYFTDKNQLIGALTNRSDEQKLSIIKDIQID